MPRDYFATIRQTLPRLFSVARHMRPTYRFDSILDISPDFLRREGIRGLVWDVDGTLMGYHARAVDPELRSHVDRLFAMPEFRHAILSNCDEGRFRELKAIFPTTMLLRGYRCGDDTVFRTALEGSDSHGDDVVRELLRHCYQIRKPSGTLLELAGNSLDVAVDELVMIGDQYLTDVASANLAGARSIKVTTFRRETFPMQLRLSQAAERALYLVRHGRRRELS